MANRYRPALSAVELAKKNLAAIAAQMPALEKQQQLEQFKKAGEFNLGSARAHQRITRPGHRTNVGGQGHVKGPSPAPANGHGTGGRSSSKKHK